MPTAELIAAICIVCRKERSTKLTPAGAPRTPTGWKRVGEDYYCDVCWRQRYMLRAVSIPVASPLDCDWEELRKALKVVWSQSTSAANRIMTECYARDVRRKPADAKMPPMPKVYLYPELRQEFPGLPSQSVAALEQACQSKYRAARYSVIWTASAALPTYRYPTPFPVPNQAWSVSIEEDHPVISVPLPYGDEKRTRLKLKAGHQFRRQMESVRAIVAARAVPGEAAIYQRGSALMVKMVAWLPRPAAKDRAGTLTVKTGKNCLLIAVNAKDETIWRYNGDHLRRWVATHRRQLQRWSEDFKFEHHPVPPFAERRLASARKFRDRMDSATHEIAAQLAGYADRRKFAEVIYNDSERGYADIPWFRLASLIKEKLDKYGITFVARGPAAAETQDPLAADKSVE